MRIIHKILLMLGVSLFLGIGSVMAQECKVPAFADGELLVYAVSYKVGFVNTDVAEVSLETKYYNDNRQPYYEVVGMGTVYPFYRWFFDLNDVYISRLNATTMRPIDLTIELNEGSYRFSGYYGYDWQNMVVNTSARNHKRPEPTLRTVTLREDSYDALALFYNLRNIDFSTFTPGTPNTLHMVLDDTVRRVQYKFVNRENKTIKGIGKFKSLKFTCQIATSSGESFKDGSEFTIWISDDQNKIPLAVESPIRVGSVRVRLLEYNGLRYPLDSKIK